VVVKLGRVLVNVKTTSRTCECDDVDKYLRRSFIILCYIISYSILFFRNFYGHQSDRFILPWRLDHIVLRYFNRLIYELIDHQLLVFNAGECKPHTLHSMTPFESVVLENVL